MIYLWQCKCGIKQEVSRPAKDYLVPPDKCECGATDGFNKIIESTSFILQGDGWFRDQYTRTGRPIK